MGRSQKTPVKWGLTGGIASGKSTAAKFFSDLGIPVVDADQISRKLSAPGGAAYDEIVKRFGTADREVLRDKVFQEPTARRDLEAILHPHIARESEAEMTKLAGETGAKIVLYEATLLVETGRYKDFDGLIVVESPRSIRKARLMERNAFSDELAEKILGSQTTDDARRKAATIILENTGTPQELQKKVHEIVLAAHWISP